MRALCLYLVLLIASLAPHPARAADTSTATLWDQGIQAANVGDYRKALERFQAIHQQGFGGAPLYYNLGSCYQHLGDKGRARASYEMAHKVAPWDGDVTINLARLKDSLDDTEPEPSAISALAEQFPTTPLAVCFSLLQLGFWVSLWLYLRGRRELHFWITLSCFALWLGSGLLLETKLTEAESAAILPQAVQLKNGPGREFSDSVTVHAGTLVKQLSHQGDWTEVEALGRVRAWIRQDDLVNVAPNQLR